MDSDDAHEREVRSKPARDVAAGPQTTVEGPHRGEPPDTSSLKAALDSIVTLVRGSREPAAVFIALFAVIVVVFLGIAGVVGGDRVGFATLVPIGLLFALVCWGVVLVERRRRREHKSRRPVLRLLGFQVALVLLLVAAGGAAYSMGVLQGALPRLFPEHAAQTALRDWVHCVDRLLQADNDSARTAAYRDLVGRFSPRYRREKLPSGTTDALAPGKEEALQLLANRFRSYYGRCSSAHIEAISRESWKSGEDASIYFLATILYRGRFLRNEIAGLKMTPLDVKNSVENQFSPHYQRLHGWIRSVFPNHDEQLFWERVREVPIAELLEANAADYLAYRFGDLLGEPNEQAFQFGNEITVSSVRMVMGDDGSWLVDEIGRWLLKRVLTEQSGSTTPVPEASVSAPYLQQVADNLCQSAALAMLFQSIRGEPYPEGQEALRKDLGERPTSHAARVDWAMRKLPEYRWQMAYVKSLPETVARLQQQLSHGLPVVMSTRLTDVGHVILVTGLEKDRDGEWYVKAHDPFGRFDTGSLRYVVAPGAGHGVRYRLRDLRIRNAAWQDPSNGSSVTSKYNPPHEEWRPTWSSLIDSGHARTSIAEDWEFLEAGF